MKPIRYKNATIESNSKCDGCNMGYFGHWCCWHLDDGKCKGLKRYGKIEECKEQIDEWVEAKDSPWDADLNG